MTHHAYLLVDTSIVGSYRTCTLLLYTSIKQQAIVISWAVVSSCSIKIIIIIIISTLSSLSLSLSLSLMSSNDRHCYKTSHYYMKILTEWLMKALAVYHWSARIVWKLTSSTKSKYRVSISYIRFFFTAYLTGVPNT